MAVRSTTITVNAAFLAEIKEDNRRLRSLLAAALEQTVLRSEYGRLDRQRVELYVALRDQLAFHFTLEDAFGYFRDALADNPRLTRRAALLHAQHEALFREICDIVEVFEQIQYGESGADAEESLTEQFLEFYDRLTTHERDENDLIFAALDDDLGVGD